MTDSIIIHLVDLIWVREISRIKFLACNFARTGVDQLFKFFHKETQQYICNKVLVKGSTIPQAWCYTTLQYINNLLRVVPCC